MINVAKKKTMRFVLMIAIVLFAVAGVLGAFFAPERAQAAEVTYTYSDIKPVSKYDYSLLAIPDIQNITKWRTDNLNAMFTQLAMTAKRDKIKFAMQLGDLCQDPTEAQFTAARYAFSLLDGVLPYAVVPGNHDYDRYTGGTPTDKSDTMINKYFTYDFYSKQSIFGGAMTTGNIINTYYLLDQSGAKYLFIALEDAPSSAALDWMDGVIKKYPDRRVIIFTHDYLNVDTNFSRSPAGQDIWTVAKKYANIFMIICGHRSNPIPAIKAVKGDNGNTVQEILFDLQNVFDEGGHNVPIVLIMKFNEPEKTVNFCMYNPVKNLCMNDFQYSQSFADPLNPAVGEVAIVEPPKTDDDNDGDEKTDDGGCKSQNAAALLLLLAAAALFAVPKRAA